MKKLILILSCAALFCPGAKGQTASSMNIEDYYYVISSDYFMCDASAYEDSRSARRNLIRICDKRNGYIEAQTSAGILCMALFRDKGSKSDVLAIYLNCGKSCMCNVFDFRVYNRDGEWESVADKVPWEDINSFLLSVGDKQGREVVPEYQLPQNGNSIVAMESNTDHKLYELKWTGQKFALTLPE